MKRSILSVALSTAVLVGVANAHDFELGGKRVEFSKKLSLHALERLNSEDKDITVVVKTTKPLSNKQRDTLYNLGAKSITYSGKNSFYLLSSKSDIDSLLDAIEDLDGVALLDYRYKISNDLKNVAINDIIRVKVELLKSLSKNEFKTILLNNGIDAKNLKVIDDFNIVELDIAGIDLESLANLSVVKYVSKYHKIGMIKPFSKKIGSNDIFVARETKADDVWRGGLDGANIKVGIVDEGQAKRDHVEFKEGIVSRVKNRVGKGDLSLHTTHVAGIIGAKGVDNYAKGMAYGAVIYNYSYQDTYFASSLNLLYNKDRILVSNHSYGFTDKADLGSYNSDASSEDSVIYNNPYIAMFVAAGNDRTRSGYPDTKIIKGAANAKNIITIGALNSSSSGVAYYSSVGPTNDGRIKPDLSVSGSAVYSTSSDGGYTYMSGTSMATPAALGLSSLVMQEYKNLTKCGNSGCDMRVDLIKAVLINTAVDKESKGPDIYTGFGMIDAKNAVDVVKTIENNYQKVKLDKVYRGESREYSFYKQSAGEFKVTISWVDMAGNSASNKALVNDIDTYLINVDTGDIYYPYVLNGLSITKGENHADNVEQIEVDNLPVGNYKLVVNGDNLQSSKSDFAIASSEAIFSKANSNIELKEKLQMDSFAKVIFDSLY